MGLFTRPVAGGQWAMTSDRFSGTAPLLVGVMPRQHPEVLLTAATLAARLGQPLVCAYVDEASYLVEWDPARSAHRLSLHPDADDEDIRTLTAGLQEDITAAVGSVPAGTGAVEWTLRMLAGDPARALARPRGGNKCAHDRGGHLRTGLFPPVVGGTQRFGGRVAEPSPEPAGAGGSLPDGRP